MDGITQKCKDKLISDQELLEKLIFPTFFQLLTKEKRNKVETHLPNAVKNDLY